MENNPDENTGRLVWLREQDFMHPDDQFRILVADRFSHAAPDPAEAVRKVLLEEHAPTADNAAAVLVALSANEPNAAHDRRDAANADPQHELFRQERERMQTVAECEHEYVRTMPRWGQRDVECKKCGQPSGRSTGNP